MLQFFHGWQRKVGCVALVMALVVTVYWVRSFRSLGLMQIGYGRMHVIYSTEGNLHWFAWVAALNHPQPVMIWLSRELPAQDLSQIIEALRTDLRKNNIEIRESTIPYWSIACPLTLLSAWLILWKPQIRKAPESE